MTMLEAIRNLRNNESNANNNSNNNANNNNTNNNANNNNNNSNNNAAIFIDSQTDHVDLDDAIYINANANTNADDDGFDFGIDYLHQQQQQHLPLNPINDIIQMFPQATRAGIEKLLASHGDTQVVISHMMEHGYEKDKKSINKYNTHSIEYNSISSFLVSSQYIKNAETQIQNDFPYLKLIGLRTLLATKNHHYYPTLLALEEFSGQKAQFHHLGSTTIPSTVNGVLGNGSNRGQGMPRIMLRPMLNRKTIDALNAKGLPHKQTIR